MSDRPLARSASSSPAHRSEAAPSEALHRLDAATMAARVAKRELTAAALVEAALARIEEVNPAVNAVVRRMDDEARRAAELADRAAADGQPLGALHGVPVTVKINIDQRGHPTDNGTALYQDLVAAADNPVVANLRAAGAIVVGRTNAPVYSMRWFTDNTLHGATYNPWHREYTVGGSSGGAAASVSSGMVPIAHGNDIGGSVRYPAFCNGLVGLRPSYGRVPSFNATAKGAGSVASQLMAVQGPIARTVRDVELAFAAMAVPHIDDPRTGTMPAPLQPAPRRAAVLARSAWPDCHPTAARAVEQAAQALAAAGWDVVEAVPPGLDELHRMWAAITIPDLMGALEPVLPAAGDPNIVTAVAYWRQALGEFTAADGLAAVARRHGLLRQWQRLLAEWPVIVMPTSLQPPFARLADVESPAMAAQVMRAQAPLLAISVLGLPALSVPTGLAGVDTVHGRIDLPTGVQLVAAPGREDLCFAAGFVVEAAMPRLCPIDPR
ncbi:amidase [Pseudacidovorax sp. NFM-22]|uniref:amidase n=1 Tax=Pseudacidovorax sp. NFM-22 TaxID=2744469 RepID=UPI002102DA20|nr:amidase [Pseudacidovorax sp. NFM-22]